MAVDAPAVRPHRHCFRSLRADPQPRERSGYTVLNCAPRTF